MDPCKVAGIMEKFYTDSMAVPSIETGTHLPSYQARRNYPWMERLCEDHFRLETPIIRVENNIQREKKASQLHPRLLLLPG
eukprot:scaffold36438_cov21-Tisochrysis_lutea.AAC.1